MPRTRFAVVILSAMAFHCPTVLAAQKGGNGCANLLMRAGQLLASHQPASALGVFGSLPPECQDGAQAQLLLGDIDEALNDPIRAHVAYREAIRLSPRMVGPHRRLAASLLQMGETQEALEEFHRALALEPDDFESNADLGIYYLRTRDFQAAADSFRRSHIERSSDPALLFAAVEAFLRAQDRAQANVVAARLLSLAPTDVRVHFSLGLLMAQAGQYKAATENFLAIPQGQRDYAAWFNLGQAYAHLNDFESAQRSFFRAIDLDHSDADVYTAVGLNYVASHQTQKALPWLMRAHDMAPDRLEIALPLVSALVQTQYCQTALNLIDQAQKRNPSDERLDVLRGDALFKLGDLDKALANYQEAEIVEPRDPTPHVAASRVLEALNRPPEAQAELQRALRLDSKDPEANAEMGHQLINRANYNEAVSYLIAAQSALSNEAQINYDLARAYFAQGKLSEAESLLQALVRSDPDNSRYHFQLARVYKKAGKAEAAESEQNRCMELERESRAMMKLVPPTTYP